MTRWPTETSAPKGEKQGTAWTLLFTSALSTACGTLAEHQPKRPVRTRSDEGGVCRLIVAKDDLTKCATVAHFRDGDDHDCVKTQFDCRDYRTQCPASYISENGSRVTKLPDLIASGSPPVPPMQPEQASSPCEVGGLSKPGQQLIVLFMNSRRTVEHPSAIVSSYSSESARLAIPARNTRSGATGSGTVSSL
jgi:hypothetical protein